MHESICKTGNPQLRQLEILLWSILVRRLTHTPGMADPDLSAEITLEAMNPFRPGSHPIIPALHI